MEVSIHNTCNSISYRTIREVIKLKINIVKLANMSVLLVAASEGLRYCHFHLSRKIPREVIVLMDHRDTIVMYCSQQDINSSTHFNTLQKISF